MKNKTQKKKPILAETITAPMVDLHKTPEIISYKNKTQKKKCKEGKELNPKTQRCNKTCKTGYKRNHEFKCVKDK